MGGSTRTAASGRRPSPSQLVVVDLEQRDPLFPTPPGNFVAVELDTPARRDRHQPSLRIRRDAFNAPLRRRREQRLLDRILACREIAKATHEQGEGFRDEVAQPIVELVRGVHISNPLKSITGRTSTRPNSASGTREATATARSNDSH